MTEDSSSRAQAFSAFAGAHKVEGEGAGASPTVVTPTSAIAGRVVRDRKAGR